MQKPLLAYDDKTSPWFSHSFFVFLTFVVPDLCFHRPWFSCSFLSISRFRNVKAASTTANMRTNYSANFSPREIFEPNLRLFLCWTFPRGIFIKDDSSTQKLSKSKNTSQLSRFKPDAHFEFCLCKTPLKNCAKPHLKNARKSTRRCASLTCRDCGDCLNCWDCRAETVSRILSQIECFENNVNWFANVISSFIYRLMFVCFTGSKRICLAAVRIIFNLPPRLRIQNMNSVLNRLLRR